MVVITLAGGNDSNNVVIPLGTAEYAEYAALRTELALPVQSVIPLASGSTSALFGLHPSLVNVAALYAQQRAAIVANVGPLAQPATKQAILADPSLAPQSLFSHPVGQQQWESSTTVALPATGWGGRIADLISDQSGALPPILNTSINSVFATGNTVQGIAVQSGSAFAALPSDMNAVILKIAEHDASSDNHLVAQIGSLRASAMKQQLIVNRAINYGSLKQTFTSSQLGLSLSTIAKLLAGRSVIGASRQLFYAQQPNYDTHQGQIGTQGQLLLDLDSNLGAFFRVLDDLSMSNDVIVCTHSDFSRTITSNVSGGSDHAWGSHQLILGGGIRGGRIIGHFPTLELGGPDDLGVQGVWVPSLAVTQMTAAVGTWLGLRAMQLNAAFPDLRNFPLGPIAL